MIDDARSTQPEIRNPILALPSAQALQQLSPEASAALRLVLTDIRATARVKAEDSWRRSKGPMAAYWKAVATYAGHIARALPKVTGTCTKYGCGEKADYFLHTKTAEECKGCNSPSDHHAYREVI